MTTDELIALLTAAANDAIAIAADDAGRHISISLSTKGLLVEAMVQRDADSYDHHAAPDGYCNEEISWEEVARLNTLAFNALLRDLLRCAVEGEPDTDEPTQVPGSEKVVRFKPRNS